MFTVIGWELQHCHQKWLKFIPDGYFTIEIRLQSHDYKIGRLNRMMQCLKVVQPRCISSSVTHFGRRARPATGKLGWWFFLLSELWEVSLSCKEMFFGVMAVRVIGHWLGYDGYLIKVFGSVSPRRWHTFAGYCHHLSGLRCLLPTGQGLTYWPCLIVVGPSALLSDFPRTSSWLITFRFCPGIALNCSALVLSCNSSWIHLGFLVYTPVVFRHLIITGLCGGRSPVIVFGCSRDLKVFSICLHTILSIDHFYLICLSSCCTL